MIRQLISVVVLTLAVLLAGCQTFMQDSSVNPAEGATLARNQGYALLYSTVEDESKVDQVLIIKDPNPQLTDLIKAIGQFASNTRDKLQEFAKEDPTLTLDSQGLPEVESRTRKAISGATSKQILFSSGRQFEFRILMTQHEALNYITHLAGTLSEQETDEVLKRYFAQVAEQAEALHKRVIAQLEAPYVGPPK